MFSPLTVTMPCKKCRFKHGNDGLPIVMPMSESDQGGYYRAHVLCQQCRTVCLGDKTDESAVAAWDKENK